MTKVYAVYSISPLGKTYNLLQELWQTRELAELRLAEFEKTYGSGFYIEEIEIFINMDDIRKVM